MFAPYIVVLLTTVRGGDGVQRQSRFFVFVAVFVGQSAEFLSSKREELVRFGCVSEFRSANQRVMGTNNVRLHVRSVLYVFWSQLK